MTFEMDFDQILPEIGSFGRYQKLLLIFITLPTSLPCSFFGFLYIFQIGLPTYTCESYGININDENIISIDNCSVKYINGNQTLTQKCFKWSFDQSQFTSTAATQFNLLCHKLWITQFTIAIFYFGSLCGQLFFGKFIDKWGRRNGFFLCLTIELLFGLIILASQNLYMFLVCQFAIGFTIASIFDIPFVSAIELVGPKKRALITILMCMVYSLGVVLFGVIAYFIRDWRILTAVVTVPFLTFYIYWWFLPESIRWLIVKQRYSKAEKIVQTVARINHVRINENFLQSKMANEMETPTNDLTNTILKNFQELQIRKRKYSVNSTCGEPGIKALLSTRNMRLKTFIITLAWVANVFSYVGLQNYLSFLSDLHLNFLLAALAELPAYLILWLTLDRVGRRLPFSVSMLVSGICVLLVNVIYSKSQALVLSLALVGKLGISTSFVIMYLYASEIYPTELRGTGSAVTVTIARIAAIIVPFITYLGNKYALIPTIFMGVLTTVAGLAALWLPETLNQKLPETLADAEKIGLNKLFS